MANTCVVGKTEKETLLRELGWLAKWSSKLLRNLKSTYTVMLNCCNMYGPNFGPQVDLKEIADAMSIQLAGACRNLRDQFDLGYYKSDKSEETPAHQDLEFAFTRFLQQANKDIPIPVDNSRGEPKLMVKNLHEGTRRKMKDELIGLLARRQHIQDILDEAYKDQGPLQPSLQLQIRIVGPNGDPVKVADDLDVDTIITEILEEQRKTIAQEQPQKTEGDD